MGVREPDLGLVRLAKSRAQVESDLGKPLWHAGSAGGTSYDLYEYPAAQPKQKVAGAMMLGFDIVTLGLTEDNVAGLIKNAPAKQTVVAYDEHDRVRSVSTAWAVPLEAHGPCRRSRALVAAEAGIPETARPAALPGRTSTVATLKLGRRPSVTINGRRTKTDTAELAPGPYALDCELYRRQCALCDPGTTSSCNAGSPSVEWLAGRVYRLMYTRLYFGFNRQDILWIEDVDSRETLSCVAGLLF